MLSYETNGIFIISTMIMIWKRFAILNQQLSNLYRLTPTVTNANPNQSLKLIKWIAIVHHQLSDAVQLFNYCFSVAALLGLSSGFAFIIFALFGLVHSYAGSDDEQTWSLAVTNVIYGALYAIQLVELIVIASLVNCEVRSLCSCLKTLRLKFHYSAKILRYSFIR